MGKSVRNAFTLIELLVVITIMGVIGAYTLANYRSFGEDRNLKSAVLDVISLLRQAQTNATTNVICTDGTWQVEFATDKIINLKCSTLASLQKILQLNPNISISSISGPEISCPSLSSLSFAVDFAPLTGKINLVNPRCTSLTVTLKNIKTTSTKSLIIEKGGRIYGE